MKYNPITACVISNRGRNEGQFLSILRSLIYQNGLEGDGNEETATGILSSNFDRWSTQHKFRVIELYLKKKNITQAHIQDKQIGNEFNSAYLPIRHSVGLSTEYFIRM